MLKVVSMFTLLMLVMNTGIASAQDKPSLEDCKTGLVDNVSDIDALKAGIDAIRRTAKNNIIGLGSEFANSEGNFQIQAERTGALKLEAAPHGTFPTALCGTSSGINVLVDAGLGGQIKVGASKIIFSIEGNDDGGVTISSDNPNFPTSELEALN